MYLEQARAPGRDHSEMIEYLKLARNSLFEAVPLQREQTIERSQVCLELALVLGLLWDAGSRKYALLAWQELVSATRNECDELRRILSPPEGEMKALSQVPRVAFTRLKQRGATFWAHGWYFLDRNDRGRLVPAEEHRMLERGEIPTGRFATHPETKALARLWASARRIGDLREVCLRFGASGSEVPYQDLRVRLDWDSPEVFLRTRSTPPGTVPSRGQVLRHRESITYAAYRKGVKSVALIGTIVGNHWTVDDMMVALLPPGTAGQPVNVGFLVEFRDDKLSSGARIQTRHALEREIEDLLNTRVYVLDGYGGSNLVQPQLPL
jgi:hypothetical protein